MSYTPTNWQTGDTITAEKLNNMESGIVSGQPYLVTFTENDGVFFADKTYAAICNAVVLDGQDVRAVLDEVVLPLTLMSSVRVSFNGIVGDPAQRVYLSIDKDGTVYGKIEPLSNEPFIVTLTPTAQDYSGTMDKTVGEINEAYIGGQEIWFSVTTPNGVYKVKCGEIGIGSLQYPSFNGIAHLTSLGAMIFIYTGITDDGTQQTYNTTIYPLTPMS